MTGADLLKTLRHRGIRVSVDGDQLRVRAPKGAMTPELQAELKLRKDELLDLMASARSLSGSPVIPETPREGPLPLSSFQRRLWVLNRLDPHSTAYHLSAWQTVPTTLDAQALKASVNEMVRRHEILRTNFQAPDGTPRLAIRDPEPVEPRILDWSHRDEAERESSLDGLISEETRTPMDLEEGPLFRPMAIRTGENSLVLLAVLHHMVTDAWSLGLLLREWKSRYEAHLAGEPLSLPDQPVQYADYAVWQQTMLEGEDAKNKEDFWLSYLENAPTVLTLPSDRPRAGTQQFEGSVQVFQIDPDVAAGLRDLCQSEGVTPFMVWLATFGLLLGRYSGRGDLLIGSPVASRFSPVLETVLGPFVNTVVFRHRQLPGDSGRTLLARTKESVLAAHAHQDVPFERLVEIIPNERTMAHPPLFQVSCAFHNQPGRSEFSVDTGGSMFELTLNGLESADGLKGSLEFNTALFEPSTIQRMTRHFLTLLRSLVEDPDADVLSHVMVPEAERALMVEAWNQSIDPPREERTFIETFQAQVSRTPNAAAATCGEEELDYSGLNGRVDRLAHRLLAEGLEPEGVVAIILDRGIEMLVAPLAVMKAGGVYVPLDPEYPQARIDYIVKDSGAGFVLTTEEYAHRLAAGDFQLLTSGSQMAEEIDESFTIHTRDPADLCYVIYTSGTTGKPKGVEITQGGLANILDSLATEPGMGAHDTMLSVTTFAFDIAAVELFLPLRIGGRVAIATAAEAEHGKRLLTLMDAARPTVMQATPASWQMLIDAGWEPSGERSGMSIWSGGEALPRPLADTLLERSDSVWNLYGPTETTIWSTLSRVTPGTGSVPIGKPVADTNVLVLDPTGSPSPIGVPGELLIGGAGLARGYRNLPELTAEAFIPNPLDPTGNDRLYRTGDLVRWTAEGVLEYVGRIDHQVKVRGHRIELGEIESVLLTRPSVRAAAAKVWESRIVVYVVFEDGGQETPSEIRRFLRDHLPEYMIPGFVVALPEFPMTANRKIDRKRLPSPDPAGSSVTPREFEPPRDGLEQAIAAIWQDLLGEHVRIGAEDNFFDLGGHSLLALKAVYRIEELTRKPLDNRAIFFETLRQIAAR